MRFPKAKTLGPGFKSSEEIERLQAKLAAEALSKYAMMDGKEQLIAQNALLEIAGIEEIEKLKEAK